MKKALVLAAITVSTFLLGYVVVAPLIYKLVIPSTGTVIYSELSADPTSIDWGDIYNGSVSERNTTLTNTGTRPFTSLNMTYGNASLNLINYTVTWDAEDIALPVGQSLMANFTLTVYNATAGPFNLDIYIQDKG